MVVYGHPRQVTQEQYSLSLRRLPHGVCFLAGHSPVALAVAELTRVDSEEFMLLLGPRFIQLRLVALGDAVGPACGRRIGEETGPLTPVTEAGGDRFQEPLLYAVPCLLVSGSPVGFLERDPPGSGQVLSPFGAAQPLCHYVG